MTTDLDGGRRVVVLLGAGRSGTTLLYKVLATHPEIGYFSNYQARFPGAPDTARLHRLLRGRPDLVRRAWFGDDGGAYFGVRRRWHKALVPTPAEAEAVYHACGLRVDTALEDRLSDESVAGLRRVFEAARRAGGAAVQLTKRTANNRRVAQLLQAFPEARFLHIVRDGRAVASSSLVVDWWPDHVLHWCGQTPRQMAAAGHDPLEVAARHWVESMQVLEQGLALLPSGSLLQLRYEELLERPADAAGRILNHVGVTRQAPQFWSILESLGLSSKPEGWRKRWTPDQLARVEAIQGGTLQRWNYQLS